MSSVPANQYLLLIIRVLWNRSSFIHIDEVGVFGKAVCTIFGNYLGYSEKIDQSDLSTPLDPCTIEKNE